MITIDLLKNHPYAIPILSNIWHEVLGKIWIPEIGIKEIESLYQDELNQNMPLTYIALYGEIPIGSCTLLLKEEMRPDLGPWIGDLVVAPDYQNQGIGKLLLDATKNKAKKLKYSKLYLFTFDSAISDYYTRLGWVVIAMEQFKGLPVTVMEIAL